MIIDQTDHVQQKNNREKKKHTLKGRKEAFCVPIAL